MPMQYPMVFTTFIYSFYSNFIYRFTTDGFIATDARKNFRNALEEGVESRTIFELPLKIQNNLKQMGIL